MKFWHSFMALSALFYAAISLNQNILMQSEIAKLEGAVFTAGASVDMMHDVLLACEKGTLQEFRENNRAELFRKMGAM